MEADYRQILQAELDARTKRNPSYSMRAFAKDIGLKAPHLSTILSGQKGLSATSAAKIAKVIGMTTDESAEFVALVNAKHARRPSTRRSAQTHVQKATRAKSFQSVDLDLFASIADWHHVAILHLLELKDFEPTVAWISSRLGINEAIVGAALARLQKLDLIDTSQPRWQLKQKFSATPNVPSRAIRHHLHQGLSNAGRALEERPPEDRDFSSVIMAINKNFLPEAKIWLKEFRRTFCQKLDEAPSKNALYSLSIQFYELTQKESI